MTSSASGSGLITDSHDPRLKKVRELLKGRNRASRVILVDDPENVVAALRSGVELFSLFLTENEQLDDELVALLPPETVIEVMSVAVAKEVFGVEKRSRVFALARKPRPATLADLTSAPGDLVVLDGVRLMGNIGAILRSTRALGFAGVVLVDSQLAAVTDRRLVRASRGMVFSLPVVLAEPEEVLEHLAAEGISIVSLEARESAHLESVADVPGRVAVLLGSEKHGPSPRLSAAAAHTVSIPIHDEVESLNVSVTAALAMYERRAHNPVGAG